MTPRRGPQLFTASPRVKRRGKSQSPVKRVVGVRSGRRSASQGSESVRSPDLFSGSERSSTTSQIAHPVPLPKLLGHRQVPVKVLDPGFARSTRPSMLRSRSPCTYFNWVNYIPVLFHVTYT